jgi:hypothetical protein
MRHSARITSLQAERVVDAYFADLGRLDLPVVVSSTSVAYQSREKDGGHDRD